MNEELLSRYMGIDFGLKRIGIAISDPLFTFAYPLITLNNDKHLVSNLSDIIKAKNITKIILGIPSDENISRTSIVSEIKKFKQQLISKFEIEIIEWDETFTSVMAQQKIRESVSKKSKRMEKGLLDMNAANIILQEYLDSVK